MKNVLSCIALLAVSACGSVENDPVYQALLANAPTEIPKRHLEKLRQGLASCDVFEEGTSRQYMTCWWPSGRPVQSATLSYYGVGLRRPHPDNLIAPGGKPITGFIKLPR